jgi:hypothetical protein
MRCSPLRQHPRAVVVFHPPARPSHPKTYSFVLVLQIRQLKSLNSKLIRAIYFPLFPLQYNSIYPANRAQNQPERPCSMAAGHDSRRRPLQPSRRHSSGWPFLLAQVPVGCAIATSSIAAARLSSGSSPLCSNITGVPPRCATTVFGLATPISISASPSALPLSNSRRSRSLASRSRLPSSPPCCSKLFLVVVLVVALPLSSHSCPLSLSSSVTLTSLCRPRSSSLLHQVCCCPRLVFVLGSASSSLVLASSCLRPLVTAGLPKLSLVSVVVRTVFVCTFGGCVRLPTWRRHGVHMCSPRGVKWVCLSATRLD